MRVTDSVEMHDVIARNYAPYLRTPPLRLQAHEVAKALPIHDGDTVLDVGAGVGRVARAILAAYDLATYYALEPSDLALYFAVRDPTLRLLRARGQDIPLPDHTCDVSFAEQVFIHIKDRGEHVRVLGEMARVTRPGGFVCLTTTASYGRILTAY